nr:unnamed protein product [Callosobruchus analis]
MPYHCIHCSVIAKSEMNFTVLCIRRRLEEVVFLEKDCSVLKLSIK